MQLLICCWPYRHLTLRPQATFGSHGRAVVLKNGKEIGHFLLSGNAVTTIATPLIFKLTRWYYPARRDGGRCCPNKQRFASADEQSLSDFTCTVHHRHLFLALKSPAAGSAEKPVRKGGMPACRQCSEHMFPYPACITMSAELNVACCSCRMGGLCRCKSWQTLAKAQLDVQADGGASEDLWLFGLHPRASCWELEHTGWPVGMPIWF